MRNKLAALGMTPAALRGMIKHGVVNSPIGMPFSAAAPLLARITSASSPSIREPHESREVQEAQHVGRVQHLNMLDRLGRVIS